MKKRKKGFSAGSLLFVAVCMLFFLVFLVLYGVSFYQKNALIEQQMAQRWSMEKDVSQVSCFFSVNAGISEDFIKNLEHSLEDALKEASIVSQSENAGARLWADAYSADGQITVESNIGKITVDALGIGGDFFLFHPMQLLSGSYFSGNDLMQDYCILDQDAAWKLFGSYDVAGQSVTIGGRTHIVTGVVKRPEGKLYEAAGLDASQIYVSYETLKSYGRNNGINHLEIVMPNPVSGFAMEYMKKAVTVEEKEVEIIENSTRFDTLNRIKHISKLSTRAMNGKAIIYPYWENVARAYEDSLARLMLFQLIFGSIPCMMIVLKLIVMWRRKTWTVKGVFQGLKNKAENVWYRKIHKHKRENVN